MKASVVTLGCKVNECESASLIRGLEELGYEVSDSLVDADLYIINTCAVTAEAEKKSRQMVARVSKHAENARIIICGCAAENHPESFLSRGNVTVVAGAQKKSKVLSLLSESGVHKEYDGLIYDEMPSPLRLKTRAFIKVQDGCNNFCTYCIIPYLRGRSRSMPLSSVVEEVKNARSAEAVIVGIDLSSWRDGDNTLKDLVVALKDLPIRIRLGSLEVGVIDEEFLSAASECKNFAPHFHLSLQSGNNSVLKKMNRHYTREEYLEKCRLIYKYFPSAAITTDIIAGFPTETEEDFLDSIKIISEAGFAHAHCFPYSPRKGTYAERTYKDLPHEVKKERLARLMAEADKVEKEYLKKFIGAEAEIVKEDFSGGFTRGYTANYIRVYASGEASSPTLKVKLNGLYLDGMSADII